MPQDQRHAFAVPLEPEAFLKLESAGTPIWEAMDCMMLLEEIVAIRCGLPIFVFLLLPDSTPSGLS
jgi:hypothetical protein